MIHFMVLLFTTTIIVSFCFERNIDENVQKAWNEWEIQFNGMYHQYKKHNRGFEYNANKYFTIKNQYLSEINKFRSWHSVNHLNENIELNKLAQAHANYLAMTGIFSLSPTKYIFGEIISYCSMIEDLGKIVALNTYSKFDKGKNIFNFDADEEEMTQDENIEGRHDATALIWKSATEIGIGISCTRKFKNDNIIFNEPLVIIVVLISPDINIIGEYKENIQPRNIELMVQDGYFSKKKGLLSLENIFGFTIDFKPFIDNLFWFFNKKNKDEEKNEKMKKA
ncbi:uncharacterized protein LOC126902745 [Daktulosphaira vitifoliae]|uniref:uncharacterized protein LOC126902745 n=1 Tax=Daktulosphaira vitifoliae TaxID=58002 RepID=UPI0021AAFE79|nr:uncharacterized protein LOC126902745 [Daktulosphaira vitifoliae]